MIWKFPKVFRSYLNLLQIVPDRVLVALEAVLCFLDFTSPPEEMVAALSGLALVLPHALNLGLHEG